MGCSDVQAQVLAMMLQWKTTCVEQYTKVLQYTKAGQRLGGAGGNESLAMRVHAGVALANDTSSKMVERCERQLK